MAAASPDLVFSCFLLSIQLQGGSHPGDGATYPWGGSLLLLSAIQKTLSWMQPEMCFCGNSKSNKIRQTTAAGFTQVRKTHLC